MTIILILGAIALICIVGKTLSVMAENVYLCPN